MKRFTSARRLRRALTAIALSPVIFAMPCAASNLVLNSDFSLGNSDFASDYSYGGTDLYPANTYSVTTSSNPVPTDYNSNWTNPIPTVPSGSPTGTQMMLVNGGLSGTNTVWSESVVVTPDTNYNFSVSVDNLYALSPATLVFSIDGSTLGSTVTVSNLGDWSQFYATWYSGSNTTANLGLIDTNTAYGGNDFAMTLICLASNSCNAGTLVGGTTGPSATPLPATFPLFAGALAMISLLGTLKRRNHHAA